MAVSFHRPAAPGLRAPGVPRGSQHGWAASALAPRPPPPVDEHRTGRAAVDDAPASAERRRALPPALITATRTGPCSAEALARADVGGPHGLTSSTRRGAGATGAGPRTRCPRTGRRPPMPRPVPRLALPPGQGRSPRRRQPCAARPRGAHGGPSRSPSTTSRAHWGSRNGPRAEPSATALRSERPPGRRIRRRGARGRSRRAVTPGRRIRPWLPWPRPIPRPSGSRSGPHSTASADSPATLRTIFPTPCLVARSS